MLFAAFWSAVNRGLRPRGTLYFLTAKSTKNSPADAFAYFVPSNVRNGRLFAGLQANRPRFLPLLAGTSFHGSGIGPGSFAAIPSFRPGKEANTRTCEQGVFAPVRAFARLRTGICIATGSFGLPDLHHKHAPSDHSEYLSITTIRPLMGADGFLIIAEQIST